MRTLFTLLLFIINLSGQVCNAVTITVTGCTRGSKYKAVVLNNDPNGAAQGGAVQCR